MSPNRHKNLVFVPIAQAKHIKVPMRYLTNKSYTRVAHLLKHNHVVHIFANDNKEYAITYRESTLYKATVVVEWIMNDDNMSDISFALQNRLCLQKRLEFSDLTRITMGK